MTSPAGSPVQLPLGTTDPAESFALEDFAVSACNSPAYQRLLAWPEAAMSAGERLLLVGPEACGKSHLAAIWRARTRAEALTPGADLAALAASPACPLLLEDIDRQPVDQAWLLHLVNWSAELGRPLLMTSRLPASRLPLTLADLRSRLIASPAVTMAEPDDSLLLVVLAKMFSDRQLRPSSQTLDYLIRHSHREFAALRSMVERLDAAALQSGRTITIPFARDILGWA